jgi:hypothetical protein
LKECPDEGNKFFLALVYGCLGGAKEGPAFSELGEILVNVLCHRLRIRPRGEGFEGRSTIVDVHAVLLNALSCFKTEPLFAGNNTIAMLQNILKPEAVVPTSPYFVLRNGRPGNGRDAVTKNWIYSQAVRV